MTRKTSRHTPRRPSTSAPSPSAAAVPKPRRPDAVERVLNLLTLLSRATSPMSREQIVAEMAKGMTPYPTAVDAQRQLFGADKNTISRELGINIRQFFASGEDAGQTRYYIDPADMFVPDLDFTPDEIAVLSIALASINPSVPQAGEALLKFAGLHGARSGYDFNVRLPLVVVRLAEATQRNRAVVAATADGPVTFEPWRVLFDKGTWYVIAHRRGSGLDDTSAECEIVALNCSDFGDDIEIVDLEPCCVRGRLSAQTVRALVHNARDVETETTVVFDSVGAARSWWDSRVKHAEPLPDGGVRVTVSVSDPARFRGWLLGFGDHVVVEGPAEVRDSVAAWLEALAAHPGPVPAVPPRPSAASGRPGPRPLAERLQRLLSIVPWLHNVESIEVSELAARVGVDTEHLLHDLQFASMCGVPPYTHDALFDFWVEDGRVYFSGDRDPRGRSSKALIARSVKLTPRQVTSVLLALAALEAVGDEQPAVASLRTKLASVVGDDVIDVRIEHAPHISTVRAAAFGCREVVIKYVNWHGEVSERVIHPLLVFVDRGEAYLKADDVGTGEKERIFRVDRILDVRETGLGFPERQVSWSGVWDFRGGVTEAVVYIAPGNLWVVDRVAHKAHVVGADGSVFLWVDVASEAWLATLLLRCGAPSQVVSPMSLHTHVRQHAERLLALYPATSGTPNGV